MAIDPELDPFLYDDPGFEYYEAFEWVGSCSMLTLGWLVAATMFQLTVSIRVIFNIQTPQSATRHKHIMYAFSGFISGSQLVLIALIPFVVKDFDKRTWVVSYPFIASYITLTTVYAVTIGYLYSTLKKMSSFGDFSKE